MYKKILIALLAIFFTNIVVAQKENMEQINTGMPQIVRPAPSAASLMKFEEVPVSTYTGIPDINIPLYSIPTLSNNVSVDLSLSYHAGSINEKANYTGLGWSLFAGGSISRTVRGIADDRYVPGASGHIGIYYNDNRYYRYQENLEILTLREINELMWGAYEKNIFDTEHDLYQFNFMGFSGRFIIKKDVDGNLGIVKLDDNILKIDIDYHKPDMLNTDPKERLYRIDSFIIYDDKGYKYKFDVKETSSTATSLSQKIFLPVITQDIQDLFTVTMGAPSIAPYGGGGPSYTSGFTTAYYTLPNSDPYTYTSSYQLSKVYGVENETLVDFFYNGPDDQVLSEVNRNFSRTESYVTSTNIHDVLQGMVGVGAGVNDFKSIDPSVSESISISSTYSKKIKRIEIINKAKIFFGYELGRDDSNANSNFKLKNIEIENWYGNKIKKFSFDYNYTLHGESASSIIESKMLLTAVNEFGVVNNQFVLANPLTHHLYYKDSVRKYTGFGTDYWGYYTLIPNGAYAYHETNPDYCTIDVLQKITFPTGGCEIFDFESNTYSYEGDRLLNDFTIDAGDDHVPSEIKLEINPGSSTDIKVAPYTQQFAFYNQNQDYNISVARSDGKPLTYNALGQYIAEGGVTYSLSATWVDPGKMYKVPVNVLIWQEGGRVNTGKQYLYGGGIRIKRIGYFKKDIDQKYYDDNLAATGNIKPDKEKNYNYNFFTIPGRSSGALVCAKPKFKYSILKDFLRPDITPLTYLKINSNNTLFALKSSGSDVGYKNVTVSETGNGESRFIYKSPIDVPGDAQAYNTNYPFLPFPDYDYKRGQVLNEKHFNEAGKILTETTYNYDYISKNYSAITGLTTFSHNPCVYMSGYSTFPSYYDLMLACSSNSTSTLCTKICIPLSSPREYISDEEIREVYGRSPLLDKTTKSYFYEGSNQKSVELKESFTYNNTNKKLKSHTTETYIGESVETQYTYFTDPGSAVNNNISRIQKVVDYTNNWMSGSQNILFSNALGNAAYNPEYIQVSKGALALENRIQYLSYDAYSNPLEVKQTGGITISYIWGYNKSEPIAKVENATYAQIATALGISVAALKNYSEANITTLNSLRSLLPNAMVTTYTYKPLVGILTNTDPRGYTTSYEYDAFGRLIAVKDAAGNLLSENKYNYRP